MLYTQHNNNDEHTSLEKYTSYFIWKGCVWEGVGHRTELQHIDLPTLMAISVSSSPSPGLLNWRPRGPALCWALFSLPHLVFKTQSGIPRAPSARCCFSLLHFLSKLTDFLSSPSYIIVHAHSISPHNWPLEYALPRLWNGMFDCHQAEITIMQFTGHSLPVHQSVTVLWDFNPVPYCQPSLPTPMEYAFPPSLEWQVWRGRRSIYNNMTNNLEKCGWTQAKYGEDLGVRTDGHLMNYNMIIIKRLSGTGMKVTEIFQVEEFWY